MLSRCLYPCSFLLLYIHFRVDTCPGSHSSLQVELSVLAPRAAPEVRFLGAEAFVGPLRDKFARSLQNWYYTYSDQLERNTPFVYLCY